MKSTNLLIVLGTTFLSSIAFSAQADSIFNSTTNNTKLTTRFAGSAPLANLANVSVS